MGQAFSFENYVCYFHNTYSLILLPMLVCHICIVIRYMQNNDIDNSMFHFQIVLCFFYICEQTSVVLFISFILFHENSNNKFFTFSLIRYYYVTLELMPYTKMIKILKVLYVFRWFVTYVKLHKARI